MQNTELKNNGQSRGFKLPAGSVTKYQSWAAFLADACSEAGVSCDITGLRAAGVNVFGTAFAKETMLPDTLDKALFGAALATRTPAEAMEKLRQLAAAAQGTADGRLQAASGSYIGTGTIPTSVNPKSVTLNFVPKIFWVSDISNPVYGPIVNCTALVPSIRSANAGVIRPETGINTGSYRFSVSGNTIQWYDSGSYQNATIALNEQNTTYYYLAIG